MQKTFVLEKIPEKARLYASAHGLFELFINGERADFGSLAPETSSYPSRLYYQTCNVAKLLKIGENRIMVLLADGWWIGRIGFTGDSCQYGDRLGFIMQLEMDRDDTNCQMICSDDSFVGRRSYHDYADLFIGERQDLLTQREESWRPCQKASFDTSNLIAQPVDPVSELDILSAVNIFRTPAGDLVADFGQVMAGVVELVVTCDGPCEIILDHSEVLDADGNYFRNIMGRNKDQRDVFLCPAGKSIIRPQFTCHGFRYVRISGVDQAGVQEIRAIILGTPIDERGFFSCSDPRLNQLQNNIRRSTKSNMFSVPTDCPQREKMGWTGDIQIFAKTGSFNFDLYNFLAGWLANVRADQRPDGEVPIVVPNYPIQDKMQRAGGKGGSSSAWGDACVLVPLYLYEYYGDVRILEDNLAMMERWLSFIAQAAATRPDIYDKMTPEQQARNQYLWNKGHHFGDWLIPSLRKLPDGVNKGVEATAAVIGSCFYAVTVQAFIRVLDALGAEGDHNADLVRKRAEYEALLGKIRLAVRDEYICDNGMIEGDLQGLYVLALYSGVAEGELGKRVANRLAELIRLNNNRLDTGFVSTPYLLDVLTDAGFKDLAYNLLFQTSSPSWLYQIEKGATSIWENWEAIQMDGTVTRSSFNHYALGSVGDWIYRHIGGIVADEPGFRRVRFQPDIDCGLDEASCSIRTTWGLVSCVWHWQDDVCTVSLETPPGVAAVVSIRALRDRMSGESRQYRFQRPV